MFTPFRLVAGGLAVSLFALPALLFAQNEQTVVPPSAALTVEQTSEIEAVGVWTLLRPNHESFQRTDATLSVPDLVPGKYSFFTVPPDGTVAHIDILLGDDVIQSADSPQITFDLADTMTLKIAVRYTLTIYGKIGVGSDPVGMPFEMIGPNGMKRKGVTPVEYSPMPIGNYSVTFSPDGCPQPPAQSGLLEKEDRVNFMIRLVCKDFRPVMEEEKPTTVTTELGGKTMTFTDVPADAWFAPYISTIAGRGIMTGYAGTDGSFSGTFGPGDPVTIAQLAKVAHTAMKINESATASAPLNALARGQWFTRYVASAEELGWSVYVDGTVDPHRSATRGEVVATLLQVLDLPVRWPKGGTFTDVLRRTPYAGAIETAAAEGIVSGSANADGTPTGLFHPADPITRAEIAKILILIREKYQTGGTTEK